MGKIITFILFCLRVVKSIKYKKDINNFIEYLKTRNDLVLEVMLDMQVWKLLKLFFYYRINIFGHLKTIDLIKIYSLYIDYLLSLNKQKILIVYKNEKPSKLMFDYINNGNFIYNTVDNIERFRYGTSIIDISHVSNTKIVWNSYSCIIVLDMNEMKDLTLIKYLCNMKSNTKIIIDNPFVKFDKSKVGIIAEFYRNLAKIIRFKLSYCNSQLLS